MSQIETRLCVESGCVNEFKITDKVRSRFKALGYELPKRCQSCRAKRKRQKQSPFSEFVDKVK